MSDLVNATGRFSAGGGSGTTRQGRYGLHRLAILAMGLGISLCAHAAPSAASPVSDYAQRAEVQNFAEQLAHREGWDLEALLRTVGAARYRPQVARLIMPAPAGQAKNWAAYRARFIEPIRLKAGVAFWNRHAETLERAEALTGVPAALIVGVIGVETLYGRHTGTFRVLDALATLSFDFPTGRSDRSGFFRQELEAFLVWCRREGKDPQQVLGSYAGAIGWPQFMPSSILRYAVDFDGDGHIDLERSVDDVIGSVARYLMDFGWEPGLPTHFAVDVPTDPDVLATLLAPDIVPSFPAETLAAKGVVLPEAAFDLSHPLALVKLENGEAPPSYLATTHNFYVVTRYNWSAYYARAVLELGAAVEQARKDAAAPTKAAPAQPAASRAGKSVVPKPPSKGPPAARKSVRHPDPGTTRR